MTLQIILLPIIIATAVVLFSLENLPVDVIALDITLTLIIAIPLVPLLWPLT